MAFRDSINDLMFRFYERFKQNNNRLPVSVDADINVGDVQIGTVKQGGVDEGAEPWKVKAEELEQKIDALKQSIESGVQLKGRITQVVIPRGVYTTTQSVTVPVPDGVGAVIVAARAHAVTGTFGVGEGWRLRTRPMVDVSTFLHASELVSPVTTSTVRGWHVIGRGVGTESGDETSTSPTIGTFLQRFQIPLPAHLEISLEIVGGTFGDGEGVDARVHVAFCW